MKLEDFKEGVGSFWDSVSEGWHHLRESASNALTHFKPNEASQLPAKGDIDDPLFRPVRGWSMLGGEVFEDEKRFVVRLEVPGMDKQDMQVEVAGNAVVLTGEKRFTREATDGRWRVMQCAYGSFRRVVPLSVPVVADNAKATYTNGVLRVELPKAEAGAPSSNRIAID